MSKNKVDRSIVGYMLNIVEDATRLELAIEHLQWKICYGEYGTYDVQGSKRLCNKLRDHLEMVQHCIETEKHDEAPENLTIVK